ncbi:Odorant receptor 82 [Frankliniella occidentalis]|nr:Odorant receptor 82 [Frankliniella occidentalis]
MCHPSTTGQSGLTKLLNKFFQYKINLVCLGYGLFICTAVLWTDQPASSKQFNISALLSAYSSLVNQLIYTKYRRPLFNTVELLEDLAEQTHRLADEQGKEAMQRSAVRSRLIIKLILSYSAILTVVLSAVMMLEYRHYAEALDMAIGGSGEPDSAWRQVVKTIGYVQQPIFEYNAFIGCPGFFLTVSLVATVTRSLVTLQEQINRGVKRGECLPWAPLQSALLRAALGSDEVFAGVLPHMLLSAFVLPLLATVDVVFNGRDADAFGLAVLPVSIVTLWPLCEIGDMLLEARKQLCTSAYFGPCLEETGAQSRVRLLMMRFSYGRRGLLRTRGLGGGVLNREAFANGMMNWLKFLNGLINLKNAL